MSHGDYAVFVVAVERWKRKVGGGWIVVFFFLLPIAVVYGCGWWGNGGSGCCDGLVFFFFPLLLRFLDLEFVGVVVVDVIDDKGEEIIYYFNV